MTAKFSRRSLLRAGALAAALPAAPSIFAKTDGAAPEESWTGFTICDSCNHVPSCGIRFEAKGNVIHRIDNWKENPNHWLCSKGWATLQRL